MAFESQIADKRQNVVAGTDRVPGHENQTLALRQTRDITLSEAKHITKTTLRVISPGWRDAYGVYWLLRFGAFLVVIYACISFLYGVGKAARDFPTYGQVAILLLIWFHILLRERWRTLISVRNQEIHRAGTRYAIDRDGLTVEENGIWTFLPWRRIDRVWMTHAMCFALFDHKMLCIPVPAFADQDAAGFVVEFKWRWERRDQLQAASEAVRGTAATEEIAKA